MTAKNLDASLHINTPLLKSNKFNFPDSNIWLKMECMQPSGSFKNRGVGVACQHYVREGAQILVSSSGGNAGIATAYSGFMLDVPVAVIVPENAPQTAIDAMRGFGADVEVNGKTWMEANARALAMVEESSDRGAVLVHPFDDPLLWPGHATLIDEVVASGCRPDAVVLSVGGGGLLTGIAMGLTNHHLSNCKITAVETTGAASLAGAIKAGKPVTLSQIDTIANTLGAKRVSDAAFEATRQFDVTSHIVSDQQALDACSRFLNDHRVLVEPACGAALSAIYDPVAGLRDKENILVVVCGGMGVSTELLAEWQSKLSAGEK